jgi:hypothetical protein
MFLSVVFFYLLSDSHLYFWSLAVRAAQKESTGNTLEFSGSRSGPYFDKGASRNVTALLGKTAYLNCRVKNLGNKTVSINNELITFIYRLHKISSSTYVSSIAGFPLIHALVIIKSMEIYIRTWYFIEKLLIDQLMHTIKQTN